jgi:hypothetical protein
MIEILSWYVRSFTYDDLNLWNIISAVPYGMSGTSRMRTVGLRLKGYQLFRLKGMWFWHSKRDAARCEHTKTLIRPT